MAFYQNSDLIYEYTITIKSDENVENQIVGVEFVLGENEEIKKYYPSNSVEKPVDGVYHIHFTQNDTILLPTGVIPTQANVKFRSGHIIPTNIVYVDVKRNLSKKVWVE